MSFSCHQRCNNLFASSDNLHSDQIVINFINTCLPLSLQTWTTVSALPVLDNETMMNNIDGQKCSSAALFQQLRYSNIMDLMEQEI